MKKGDSVRVRRAASQDEWCPARVAVISGNGLAIGLLLDGIIRAPRGYVRALLIWPEKNGEYYQSVTGGTYELETVV